MTACIYPLFPDAVDHILKNPLPCGRSQVCVYGAAARTYSCIEWCIIILVEVIGERKVM